MAKYELDETDKKILRTLQENCKQSSRQLSNKLGIPPTTIHQRIKKLEQRGVILGFQAVVDQKKIGLATTALVLLTFSSGDPKPKISQEEVADKIAKDPSVSEVHMLTGNYDMLVKVRGHDERTLGRDIVHKIRTFPGVDKTLTSMVIYTSKDTQKLKIE